MGGVILMIGLCRIKHLERLNSSHNTPLENCRLVELIDISLGDALLLRAGEENNRTILRPCIGTLTIQLSRIMRGRKENLQKLSVADL